MNAVRREQQTGEVLFDLPAEEYHRRELGVASATSLELIVNRSPAHYRAWVDAADRDTPATVFGRAYHMRVLQPELFAANYAIAPEEAPRRPTQRQRDAKKPGASTLESIAFWDAFDIENRGKELLDRDDFERIEAMHAALMLNPLAAGIMRSGRSEMTLRWVDEGTGVRCKARPDWNVEERRFFADLKSTDDASPEAFSRSIWKYGYDIQHAHYCEGARRCGIDLRHFLIIAQEKEPPYVCVVYHLDAPSEIRGMNLRRRGLERMRDCLASQTWPGYSTGITEISVPAWALKDHQ